MGQSVTLNRSTPLKAKTPLQRTALKSGGEISRKRPSNLKTKKKPKPKKPTSTQYKMWCDTLFSLIVRSRGACQKCGSELNLQCSHVVSRGYLATRWDEANALCMDRGCHHWQHMRPLENEEWLASIGIDTLELKRKALTHERPDYPAVLSRLVARAEELGISVEKYRKHLPFVTRVC